MRTLGSTDTASPRLHVTMLCVARGRTVDTADRRRGAARPNASPDHRRGPRRRWGGGPIHAGARRGPPSEGPSNWPDFWERRFLNVPLASSDQESSSSRFRPVATEGAGTVDGQARPRDQLLAFLSSGSRLLPLHESTPYRNGDRADNAQTCRDAPSYRRTNRSATQSQAVAARLHFHGCFAGRTRRVGQI